MADTYMIGDVKIEPQGGGYYELTSASGAKQRVRGKQVAEDAAKAMATPKGDPEAQMPAQPPLDEVLSAAPAAPTPSEPVPTVTVQVAEEAPARIPVSQVPNEFTGVMEDKTRERLNQLGVTTSRIILEESESIPPTGLFVGHNNRSYMIRPGEEVDVPNFVLEVLDNAIMSTPIVDPTTKRVLGYRNRSKYPYRRV